MALAQLWWWWPKRSCEYTAAALFHKQSIKSAARYQAEDTLLFFALWCLHQQKLLLFFWKVNTLLLLVPTLITWRRKRSRRSPCLVPDLSVLLHHPESWPRTFLDSSSVYLSTVYLILIWRLGWRGRDRFQLSSVPSGPGSRHHRNSQKKESRCLRQLVQSCDIFFFLFFFCRSAPNVKIVAQSFTALPIFLSLSVCVPNLLFDQCPFAFHHWVMPCVH